MQNQGLEVHESETKIGEIFGIKWDMGGGNWLAGIKERGIKSVTEKKERYKSQEKKKDKNCLSLSLWMR